MLLRVQSRRRIKVLLSWNGQGVNSIPEFVRGQWGTQREMKRVRDEAVAVSVVEPIGAGVGSVSKEGVKKIRRARTFARTRARLRARGFSRRGRAQVRNADVPTKLNSHFPGATRLNLPFPGVHLLNGN